MLLLQKGGGDPNGEAETVVSWVFETLDVVTCPVLEVTVAWVLVVELVAMVSSNELGSEVFALLVDHDDDVDVVVPEALDASPTRVLTGFASREDLYHVAQGRQ